MDSKVVAGSMHRTLAGLFLVVLGCGSGTLVSPDAGSTGSAGTSGTAGITGSAGTSGTAGITGSAATSGAAGTIGSDEHGCGGFLGSRGSTGGDTGTAGVSGAAGGSGTCGNVTTLADCDASSDCHPVFVDQQDCRCATLGCCAMFSRCAVGERATCRCIPEDFDSTIHGACNKLQIEPRAEGHCVVDLTVGGAPFRIEREMIRGPNGGIVEANYAGKIDLRMPSDGGQD